MMGILYINNNTSARQFYCEEAIWLAFCTLSIIICHLPRSHCFIFLWYSLSSNSLRTFLPPSHIPHESYVAFLLLLDAYSSFQSFYSVFVPNINTLGCLSSGNLVLPRHLPRITFADVPPLMIFICPSFSAHQFSNIPRFAWSAAKIMFSLTERFAMIPSTSWSSGQYAIPLYALHYADHLIFSWYVYLLLHLGLFVP